MRLSRGSLDHRHRDRFLTGGEASVPKSTIARWRGRLMLPALVLAQVLLGAGVEVSSGMSMTSTCAELVDGLADEGAIDGERKLEQVAGWVHRVMPGVRLM